MALDPFTVAMGVLSVGSILGGGRSARRAKAENERRFTRQAFDIGANTYEGRAQSMKDIEDTYASNLSSERARLSASGIQSGSFTWNSVLADVGAERDTALNEVGEQRKDFETGEIFGRIKSAYDKDVARLHGPNNRTRSRTSPSQFPIYSVEQEGMIHREIPHGKHRYYRQRGIKRRNEDRLFMLDYRNSLTPTFEEYELLHFGSDEEKKNTRAGITGRINQANTKFDQYVASL